MYIYIYHPFADKQARLFTSLAVNHQNSSTFLRAFPATFDEAVLHTWLAAATGGTGQKSFREVIGHGGEAAEVNRHYQSTGHLVSCFGSR